MTANAKAMVLAVGGGLLALAAAAATQAAAASLDISGSIAAKGTKPAWALRVSGGGTSFTLTRPGKPVVHATAPGAMITPAGASWSAKAADGQAMQVTLQNRGCTLGGAQYPMAAQVSLGGETFSGCAANVR